MIDVVGVLYGSALIIRQQSALGYRLGHAGVMLSFCYLSFFTVYICSWNKFNIDTI